MLLVREVVEPRIRWIIGQGNVDAYKDSLCSSDIRQNSSMMKLSCFFKQNGFPAGGKSSQPLGSDAHEEIQLKGFVLA